MKNFKRFLSLALAVLMTLSYAPTIAYGIELEQATDALIEYIEPVEEGELSTEPIESPEEGEILEEGGEAELLAEVTETTLDGEGTAESPYLINDLDDLKWFRDDVNSGKTYAGKYVKLTEDINLTGEVWTPIGTSNYDKTPTTEGVKMFAGNFDGGDHTITGLSSVGYVPASSETGSTEYSFGLFGYVYGANISNVKLADVNIECGTRTDSEGNEVYGSGVAALVGYYFPANEKATVIENCHVLSGTVAASNNMGGLIGHMDSQLSQPKVDITIRDCSNAAAVTTEAREAGGILGLMNSAREEGNYLVTMRGTVTFENCVNTGAITSLGGGAPSAGGILGRDHNQAAGQRLKIVFDGCENSGTITVTANGETHAAGIGAGYYSAGAWLIAKDCENTGDVVVNGTGDVYAGGLISYGGVVELIDSTSTGTVTGGIGNTHVGGAQSILFLEKMDNFTDTVNGYTYYLNGGTSPEYAALVDDAAYGGNFHLVETAYKDGSEFVGWYDNAELTGEAYTALNANVKTYYAKWVVCAEKVGTFAELQAALENGKTNIELTGDIYVDESIDLTGIEIDVKDYNLYIATIVRVTEEKEDYNVTETKAGSITGFNGTPGYVISLDGGNTWITDTTNGNAQAVTVKTDGTTVLSTSFQSAFTSANTGEIVHLLKDVHVQSTNPKKNNGPLRSYYGLILEGNGHTIYTDLESSGASNEYATIKFTSYLAGTGPEVNPVLKNVTIDSQKNAKADLDFVSGDVTFTVTMYNVNLLGNCQYASFAMKSPSMIINKSKVEIYDCTIPSWDAGSANAIDLYSGEYSLTLNSKCTVYGGTFTKDVTNYLAEGRKIEMVDGKYVVKIDPTYGKVAEVNGEYYETLAKAIEAAQPGDTITFLADITEDVTISKNLTIDGANKTYTGMMTLKADTTIQNVNFDGKGYNGYAVETRGANYLTIEDCTAKNYGYGFVQLASGTALTTVKNVTASNMNYGVKIDYSNAVVLENVDITATVAAVLNSNYGAKTITIKNSDISILGTWTRNDTIKSTYVFEGDNSIDEFVIDAAIDVFKLAAGATLTAPEDIEVITDVEDHQVKYENGAYIVVEKDFVAQVGETKYESLEEAVAAATEGATITLLADVVLADTLTIPAEKTITLDLNGKTISQTKAQTAGYQMILNDGNLTIADSVGTGKISYTDSGNGGEYISDTIYNRGTLVIKGGTIENLSSETVASNGYPHAVDNYSGIRDTSLTIEGGTIYCAEYSAIRMFCVSATNKADLVINGGTIKGAVDMQNGTKDAALGSLTINDGTFETTKNANNIRFANWNGGATEYGITAEIKGGSFNGGITTQYVPAAANWNSKIITGGTFSVDPSKYLAEGYVAVENGDGTYGVEVWDYTIKNKAQLLMFAEMVNGGETFAGKTVTLAADIDLAGIDWTPIGNDTNYFCGTFDGQNHIISNMTINVNTPDENVFAGLFGGIKKATVKNLTMTNVNIDAVGAKVRAAAVVGIAHSNSENRTDATINFENIAVNGCTIKAEAKSGSALVGGVVGYNYPADMSNITVSDLTINAKAEGNEVRAAAINGYVCGQNISNNGNTRAPMTVDTFNVSNVSITADAYTVFAGGYAPYTYYGYITLKDGNIDGLEIDVDAHEAFVGGLVGYFWRSDNGHTVNNVNITGIDFDVTTDYLGETRIGGVVGTSQSPNTKYTNVSVSGKIVERCSDSENPVNYHAKVGGFVARTYEYAQQTYTNCVADVDVTGSNIAGGFVGNHNSTVSYVNCEAKGDVTANTAGGFAGRITEHGYTTDVTFDSCKAFGVVTGTNVAGGFIGSTANHGWAAWAAGNGTAYGKNITLKDCVASETVTVTGNTKYVAGVIGEAKVADGKTITLDNVTYTVEPAIYPIVVAQIGDKEYYSLQAAVEAATEGDTITVVADIELDETLIIPAGKTITLDLNGKTVSYTSNTPGEDMITNKGNLTITDSTEAKAGKLTYNNTDTTASNVTVSTISTEPGSVLTVKAGTIENKTVKADGSSIYPYAIDILTNGSLGDVTVNVEGGTVYSDYMAIRQFNNGEACKNTLNVTSGYIYGAKRAIQIHFKNNAAYTTISGGKVEGGNYSLCFLTTSENVSVTGGEFIGDVWYSGTKGFISGGTYTQDVFEYLAPDTGLVYDEVTDTYTTTNHVYNLYFRDPVTGEQSADVGPLQGNDPASLVALGKFFYADYYKMELEVLYNAKIDETIVIDYPMTVNLNGKTLTVTDDMYATPAIRVLSDVTVKGGTIDATAGTSTYAFIVGNSNTAGTLTIKDGTYKGSVTAVSVTKGIATIEDGTFEATEYEGAHEFTLNCIDANYKDGSAKIEVEGGTFYKFNPADNAAEGAGTNFVPKGYKATQEGDNYTVAANMIFEIRLTDANGEAHWLSPLRSNDPNSILETGKVWYDSLQGTYDFTLVFLEDYELDETVVVNFPLTIDGAGKTLTGMIENRAELTIKNVTVDGGDLAAIDNYGKLTVESGTYSGAMSAIYNNELTSGEKAEVIIKDGEFTAPGDWCATIENRYGILTVNGGKITATADASYAIVDTCGETTINGGEIISAKGTAVETYDGKIVIRDGEFTGKVIVENQAGEVDVYGGTLVSNTPEYYYGLTIANGGATTLYGGTYERDYTTAAGTSVKVAEGYAVENNGDGTYTVKELPDVAAIGETKYKSLAKAIAAAQPGDIITFLADITENVTVSKSVTIDGAKFKYTGTMTVSAGFTVTVQNVKFVNGGIDKSTKSTTGTYTIKNCTFDGEGKYAYPLRFKGANNVTVENCTVKNYLYSFLYITSGTNTVSVNNVTVEDCPNYAIYFSSGVNSATIEGLTVKNSNNGFVINNTANRALTIKNCKMENVTTAINHSDGTNTITCTVLGNENDFGTAATSQYAKYVLAETTATLTAPESYTVTTSVADHEVVYRDGKHIVINPIAKVIDKNNNEAIYNSLQEAINAAEDDETVVLLKDINLAETELQTLDGSYDTYFLVEGKSVTIDLAGHKIFGAYTGSMLVGVFSTDKNGHITLTGNGTVDVTATGSVYCLITAYNDGSTFTIKNGTYKLDKARTNGALVYYGGYTDRAVTVNGGTFYLGNIDDVNSPWIFNVYGAGDHYIYVTGGTYYFDINRQKWSNEVLVPETYYTVDNGDGTWTVKDGAVAYVKTGMLTGPYYAPKNIGYATIEEAFEAAVAYNDRPITLLESVDLEANVEISIPNIVLDCGDYTLTCGDKEIKLTTAEATLTAPEGLNVTTSVEGATAFYDGTKYYVGYAVAAIGNTNYPSLQAAINAAAQTGDTIVLLKDINLAEAELQTLDGSYDTYFKVEGKNVTLDLAGHKISGEYTGTNIMLVGVFSTDNNGHLTLTGNGTVDVTATNKVYSLIANYENGCSITIENGTYKLDNASDSLIYSGADECVTVKGGNFTLGNVGTGSNDSPWIFNAKGQNTANIIVTGGTFNADIFHQYYIFEVKDTTEVAELLGVPVKAAQNNGDGTWTVVDAVAYVNEQHKSDKYYTQNTGYATIEEAFAAAGEYVNGNLGYTVTLVKDVNETVTVELGKAITLELNGKTFSGEIVLTDAEKAELTAVKELNVTSGVDGYFVVYENGTHKLAEAVAEIVETGAIFTTVQEAADAASENQTVRLLANSEEDIVMLGNGITLNLNGKVLTTRRFISFEGDQVTDSYIDNNKTIEGTGLLKADKIIIDDGNTYAPVWTGEGYLFADVKFAISSETTTNGVKFTFLPAPILDVVEMFKDGVADNKVGIVLRIYWDSVVDGKIATSSMDVTIPESLVESIYGQNTGTQFGYPKRFSVEFTNVASFSNLSAQAMVISDFGPSDCSNVKAAPVVNN
ncbi:MAG: right-handed parallel beta-helix repeat-containing protein [Oscillospiraceae bacterium]|nr:right-handed parallel beta-helix repeat-containing protein [Oscillospiraceae bacterium]